jgi:hypothetical protein
MAGNRRMPREKATAAQSTLLEAICAGGAHADCVTAVYVFGSYARGALTVGDVDVDIEYDARLDPAVERELMDNLLAGRDWNTPFRKALKPARALQVCSTATRCSSSRCTSISAVTTSIKRSPVSPGSSPTQRRVAPSATR